MVKVDGDLLSLVGQMLRVACCILHHAFHFHSRYLDASSLLPLFHKIRLQVAGRGAAASGSMAAPPLGDANSSACASQCLGRTILRARCVRMQSVFDRVVDCVLPLFPALSLAANNRTHAPCLLWTNLPTDKFLRLKEERQIEDKEKIDLHVSKAFELVELLLGRGVFHLISDGACAVRLRPLATLLHHSAPGERVHRLLHRSVRSVMPPALLNPHAAAGPYAVVVWRLGNRIFANPLQGLVERLQSRSGMRIRVYYGSEPPR